MVINLDNLDSITKSKYEDFKKTVQKLLAEYEEIDHKRFDND